ncbi:winged helix-turn-helix domain-containing protein [Levilactobacillus suantsaiihabitans]|uniref:winged helix-turn-helix domain-containing protein n=1 Tax=Levilactobacillus suantsaiihabitans TaxID=2487722 RepID=UPI001436A870|nr:winged helix-turn-helix domain-containing protein [Levilactobacillus suantsaiihabitans]
MKVTILLVEDEEGLRTLLSAELGFEDYTVIPCASGEAALTQREFDLLVTFMQHPGEVLTRDDQPQGSIFEVTWPRKLPTTTAPR